MADGEVRVGDSIEYTSPDPGELQARVRKSVEEFVGMLRDAGVDEYEGGLPIDMDQYGVRCPIKVKFFPPEQRDLTVLPENFSGAVTQAVADVLTANQGEIDERIRTAVEGAIDQDLENRGL